MSNLPPGCTDQMIDDLFLDPREVRDEDTEQATEEVWALLDKDDFDSATKQQLFDCLQNLGSDHAMSEGVWDAIAPSASPTPGLCVTEADFATLKAEAEQYVIDRAEQIAAEDTDYDNPDNGADDERDDRLYREDL